VSRPQSIPLRHGGFLRWAGILSGRRTPSLSLRAVTIHHFLLRTVFGMQAHKDLAYWAMMSPSTSDTEEPKKKPISCQEFSSFY
jgi:hypothetical protein